MQSLRGYEEYVLSTRKHLPPTEVQVQASAVLFLWCELGLGQQQGKSDGFSVLQFSQNN